MRKNERIADLAQKILDISGGPKAVSPKIKFYAAIGMIVEGDAVTPEDLLGPPLNIPRGTLYSARRWKKVREMLNIGTKTDTNTY